MNAFKQQCIGLREKDMTLPEIVKVTGRPKTSVWFHIKSVPLSKEKQEKIAQRSRERIAKYGAARKGKSVRSFKRFARWNTDLVFLVSHLLFDGQIYKTSCVYHNRNDVLVDRVKQCMRRIYTHEPKRRARENGVISISYYNVALTNYLQEKSEELLREVCTFPLELRRVFLKAFFDDEGCADFRPKENRRKVRGYQNDIKLLTLVQDLLRSFDIESKLAKSYVHEVVITGKENLIKFQKEINFSPGVRINGKRANSVWKKSLEKRKILQMAIDSYKT